MSAKPIHEYHGKRLLSRFLSEHSSGQHIVERRLLHVTSEVADPESKVTFETLAAENPWVNEVPLVVKPDQLIKRRGKAGLIGLNKNWQEVQEWIGERMNRTIQVEQVSGILHTFIVEPMIPHADEDEYYVCIQSDREGEEVLFHHEGGVDVGDVDSKAVRMRVGMTDVAHADDIRAALLTQVAAERQETLATFLEALIKLYRDLNFAYMEINPIVITGDRVFALDMAAKIDETASFLCHEKWGPIEFPAPFGRPEMPEEKYIRDLDSKTGASLKLTILNPAGRVWTMVAGGGASVVYADTISDLGFGPELANYGEYSGAPSEALTYEYARTILSLMCREHDDRGKVLIIGGGIANFTDVAQTFKGIIHALKDSQADLRERNVRIWVRRGGPNYQEGLRLMQETGSSIGVPIAVYGPETHITAIVPMALGLAESSAQIDFSAQATNNADNANTTSDETGELPLPNAEGSNAQPADETPVTADVDPDDAAAAAADEAAEMNASSIHFTSHTRCIVYGLQPRAVQGMLDFDHMCKRSRPSVAAMVFPFSGNHFVKFYWGTQETLIPVYTTVEEAVRKHQDVHVFINFASFRSVYTSTMEALAFHTQLRTLAIIAEGVPESQTRVLIKEADSRGVGIIGPATVGGIKPGCFRIGNTGGMLDNILMSKLYRPGSVAYVSKSGGMSNELNNIISRNTNGVYEGVAIGGDRYPGSRFIDHLLRFNDQEDVKMMVLLGEVGGSDEYEVCRAIESGRITKPVVAWCIGTCATLFPFEVQFGHAGALANADLETSAAKNAALRAAGAVVPENFDQFGACIKQVYQGLVTAGTVVEMPEPPVPKVPMDYAWAKNLGLIRKPSSFVSTICDDRGDELLYAGMPISRVFAEDLGVGGVVSLLWFQRRLPIYATKFIEMVLMVTADHGPAVSGAHNTIVTARAGKDLISSLVSGLLTIGPRFGGALDAAAEVFSTGYDQGVDATTFVRNMREQNKLIMGIGHKIKSVQNPDMRVTIIREFAKKHFPSTGILDFALQVEAVTTKKRNNLILNVDGCIACCFVDLLRGCGAFSREEADEMVATGVLNGLFVLGRSIGFIGHFLDQKRLKQGLYRHPVEDISYQGQPL